MWRILGNPECLRDRTMTSHQLPRDRRDFAAAFFAALRKQTDVAGGPPPLGLHILLGETAAIKIRNMVDNVAAGRVAPVEMIALLGCLET